MKKQYKSAINSDYFGFNYEIFNAAIINIRNNEGIKIASLNIVSKGYKNK